MVIKFALVLKTLIDVSMEILASWDLLKSFLFTISIGSFLKACSVINQNIAHVQQIT